MTTAASEVAAHAQPVEARGPWWLMWRRFRRDRLSVLALALLLAIIVASFVGGPLAAHLLGHTDTDLFPYAVNDNLRPVGLWAHVPDLHQGLVGADGLLAPAPVHARHTLLVLGGDGPLGRDELLRVLDGGKTSLEIAVGGVLIALLIGIPLGGIAGFYGGIVDGAISRLAELVMAFPLILLLVMLSVRVSDTLTPIGIDPVLPPGVFAVALVIGLFTWFYPARLVRAQVLSLRNAEFVEAARMVGASDVRILRTHLFSHVLPAVIVWSAVAAGTNILLEVGISFLGVGVQASTPTWGSLLSTTWGTIFAPHTYDPLTYTPWQTILPSLAILLAVVGLNQLGEGLRRALEPRSRG